MNGASHRAALTALAPARPIVARLDVSRHADETAADILEAWTIVETGLRTLLGGSALGGQPLIQELRQRQLLSLDQAHALLEFLAARDRVQRTQYRPTTADVAAAREGFRRLESGLTASATSGAQLPPASTAGSAAPTVELTEVPPPRSRRSPLLALGLVVVLLAIAVGVWWWSTSYDRAMRRGTQAYREGRTERAREAFQDAARSDPTSARPWVYQARLARDQRDLAAASRALDSAARRDANDFLVHQELGRYFLTVRRPDAAARSFERALRLNGTDRESMGYMGCALSQMGRADVASRMLARAGQGPWTACAPRLPTQMMPSAPPA